jgi:hypothetical protein
MLTHLILWLISPVLNYKAQLHEQDARELANAWGDVPHLHGELRTSQRILAHRASAGPSGTYSSQVLLPSTRLLLGGERKYNG